MLRVRAALALRSLPLLLLIAAAGCAARQDADLAPARVPAQRVLVLTSQGVDPAKDTVGYNAFVRGVTQAFSNALRDDLAGRGKTVDVVLNQDPALPAADFLARSVARDHHDAVVQLQLVSDPVGDAFRISLVARFMPLRYGDDGRGQVVTPVEGTTWSAALSSPDGKDEGATSMEDLARRLADVLAARGAI
jgi:hypothetical protein